MIEAIRKAVPVVTFIAGVGTAAITAHRLIDEYTDPKPAYVIYSVKIAFNPYQSFVFIDVQKARKECSRTDAILQFVLTDGTTRSATVDMGGHLSPGRYVIKGKFDDVREEDVDKSVQPIFQTTHNCGANDPPVVAQCKAYFVGAEPFKCKE